MRSSKNHEHSIYRHMLRGALWAVTMRWGIHAIGFVSVLILARLLGPDDFGIAAMGSLTIGFIRGFSELGVQQLLIREKEIDRAHCDTAWTIKVLQGVFVGVTLFVLAPYAGKYFADDRVIPVMRLLAISAVFMGAQNIGMVLALKDLDFARDFRFNLYVRIISFFITISLAIILRDYWALVWGQILSAAVSVPLSFLMHEYRPTLCLVRAKEYLTFGASMIPVKIGRFLNNKVDSIVVGGLGDAKQLGAFNVASDLSGMFTKEILAPIGRGLMPSYAKLNHDAVELAKAFRNVLNVIAVIVIPLGLGLSATSREVVAVVLGDSWLAAAPLVKLLAIYTMLTSILHTMSGQILIVSGNERKTALLMWIRLAILIPFTLVGSRIWGLQGVANGAIASALVAFPICLFALVRSIPITFIQIMLALWRPVCAGSGMWLTVRWMRDSLAFDEFINLLILVAIGGSLYLAILALLWRLAGRPTGAEAMLVKFFFRKFFGKPNYSTYRE